MQHDFARLVFHSFDEAVQSMKGYMEHENSLLLYAVFHLYNGAYQQLRYVHRTLTQSPGITPLPNIPSHK